MGSMVEDWGTYGRTKHAARTAPFTWNEIRYAAGLVGLAVARRFYPAARVARRAEHPADLLLPRATNASTSTPRPLWIEAKAAATRGRVVLTDNQLDLIQGKTGSPNGGRFVVSLYCLRSAKGMDVSSAEIAVARAVRAIFDVDASSLVDAMGPDGWMNAGAFADFVMHLGATTHVVARADLRMLTGTRAQLTFVPLLRVGGGEGDGFALKTTRERRGARGVPF